MNTLITQPLSNAMVNGNNSIFPGIISSENREIEALIFKVLREDDYPAFQKLFKKMYSPLCQFCFKFVGIREVAEELVSDVFYSIWKNRDKIVVNFPRAYLFAAVRNRGFDYLRKEKNTKRCDIAEAEHVASDQNDSVAILIQHELIHCMEQSIASLPKQCRIIFDLSREQGMKYKDIALHLKISIKTVETQMCRALKKLRESMAE